MGLLNIFGRKKASGSVAKNRLMLVVVNDRTNCSPYFLEMLRKDIIKAVSSYIDIDEDELNIQISQTGDQEESISLPMLKANIPIKKIRHKVSE